MNDPEMSDPERGRHITLFSLLLNYIPFLYLLSGGYIAWAWIDPSWGWAFVILWIYFVPPIVCRLTLLFFARPEGRDRSTVCCLQNLVVLNSDTDAV